ncbi:hypothetical protein SERLA73DRAFT_71535 [Serpula lacrymans var. lacrymans S7.3]|uniref:Uncharacterized protein n=2 Tax=Serpula lacrymans var. lacrymans TaxID=341189 RepID=F8PTI5_SERL3|nr:uncharacterized protein SERLADRAFT_435920 [Serpula lacrymans var. lacrymans S7.9]EGO00513.1 hypothetical protein SERLA73DRAFT_71535 [Serpula lacrymans var. lacrymans S7.3]EGO26072.1 hypothetical protein SERLADRAFT_435920 [Serpula lacrymans var. lacrymans S7.9]
MLKRGKYRMEKQSGKILLTEARTRIEQDGCTGTPPPNLSHRSLLYPEQTSVTLEPTYHIVTQQPPSTLSVEKYIPTVPTSPISQELNPSSPCSIGSNPKPQTSQLPPPRPVPNSLSRRRLMNQRGAQHGRQEVILQIPAGRTPLKRQSHTSGSQKNSPPGCPSNPINVDDTDMINQLYAGTYDLEGDDPPTPQSNTSSNTRQKYHQGVCNNAPYCQNCGWSNHCTYYCKADYCPNCDRCAPVSCTKVDW